jgi:hypothetical protein
VSSNFFFAVVTILSILLSRRLPVRVVKTAPYLAGVLLLAGTLGVLTISFGLDDAGLGGVAAAIVLGIASGTLLVVGVWLFCLWAVVRFRRRT